MWRGKCVFLRHGKASGTADSRRITNAIRTQMFLFSSLTWGSIYRQVFPLIMAEATSNSRYQSYLLNKTQRKLQSLLLKGVTAEIQWSWLSFLGLVPDTNPVPCWVWPDVFHIGLRWNEEASGGWGWGKGWGGEGSTWNLGCCYAFGWMIARPSQTPSSLSERKRERRVWDLDLKGAKFRPGTNV